ESEAGAAGAEVGALDGYAVTTGGAGVARAEAGNGRPAAATAAIQVDLAEGRDTGLLPGREHRPHAFRDAPLELLGGSEEEAAVAVAVAFVVACSKPVGVAPLVDRRQRAGRAEELDVDDLAVDPRAVEVVPAEEELVRRAATGLRHQLTVPGAEVLHEARDGLRRGLVVGEPGPRRGRRPSSPAPGIGPRPFAGMRLRGRRAWRRRGGGRPSAGAAPHRSHHRVGAHAAGEHVGQIRAG